MVQILLKNSQYRGEVQVEPYNRRIDHDDRAANINLDKLSESIRRPHGVGPTRARGPGLKHALTISS